MERHLGIWRDTEIYLETHIERYIYKYRQLQRLYREINRYRVTIMHRAILRDIHRFV